VRAYDRAVEGYLTHRADAAQRIGPLLAADPEFGMAHVLRGYLPMTAYDAAFVPRARIASKAWPASATPTSDMANPVTAANKPRIDDLPWTSSFPSS
jgi:hypothetical protein